MLGAFEELIEIYDRWLNLPDFLHLVKAAAFAKLGRIEEAKEMVREYHRLVNAARDPLAFIEAHMRMVAHPKDREHWCDGYRKAGLEI